MFHSNCTTSGRTLASTKHFHSSPRRPPWRRDSAAGTRRTFSTRRASRRGERNPSVSAPWATAGDRELGSTTNSTPGSSNRRSRTWSDATVTRIPRAVSPSSLRATNASGGHWIPTSSRCSRRPIDITRLGPGCDGRAARAASGDLRRPPPATRPPRAGRATPDRQPAARAPSRWRADRAAPPSSRRSR